MTLLWIFPVLIIAGLMAYLVQVFSLGNRITRKPVNKPSFHNWPPVSVLKPLKGLDDNLFDNLESFCRLDYPQYEIIFSLQDRNDPACKVAQKIKDKHPERDISIVIERCGHGLNPKVNNLIPAEKTSKYEYILISDSNVMVGEDYLKETMAQMADPEVGLVSNLIKGVGGRTFGARLENLHLNSFVMGSVSFLDSFLKMPCVVGKSMLMRKSDLKAIGGFPAVKDVLAEDYLIGKKMHEAGKRVVLSNYLVQNVNHYWSFERFLNRHTRWGKLRWKIGGLKYISELVGNPVFLSAALLVISGPGRLSTGLALLAGAIKMGGDFYIGRKLCLNESPLNYLLVPLKDLFIGLVWFVPFFSSAVVWRGNQYTVGKDSFLSQIPESRTLAFGKVFNAIRARLAYVR